MRSRFKLHCISWNPLHVRFSVYDGAEANCGTLTMLTKDVWEFVNCDWHGEVFWNGLIPADYLPAKTSHAPEDGQRTRRLE